MITKDDQRNIINYLESQKGDDTPIENGAISILVTLIQLGMLDHIISEGDGNEFADIAIHKVHEYIDILMKDEKLNELMGIAFDNAIIEEA